MTLIPYLGLLAVGSPLFQQRPPWDVEQQLQSLHAYDLAQRRSELQVLATLSLYQPTIPDDEYDLDDNNSHSQGKKEQGSANESMTGLMVAIGTMMTNYAVSFPIVVFRHSLQATSNPTAIIAAALVDTPRHCWFLLRRKYQRYGFRALYAGFGLGLISQAITTTYESFLASLVKKILTVFPTSSYQRYFLKGVHKCCRFAIHLPLYSLSKTALVLRVQSPQQPLISSPTDFLQYYSHDLHRFISYNNNDNKGYRLSLWSTFIPSCLLNWANEKCMMYFYKRIFRYLTKGKQRRRRQNKSQRIMELDDTQRNEKKEDDDDDMEDMVKRNKRQSLVASYYPEIASGLLSSMLTRALCYPIDTVIFKLMLQDSGLLLLPSSSLDTPLPSYYFTGFWDCCFSLYRQQGWKGFFPGWGAGVLELAATWMILEASWWTYYLLDQRRLSSSRKRRLEQQQQ
ncbi:mitochondrial carrier domain-containing protein [Halteromyces radiatus]|uniref:mitochondrial carrier domain-containing protein n=1 Tax=Halteromyces radiatus TaxID=101107 RepID=UPI00222082ED|nr:mitochondrial carrier domain-containing protein [Halteromyces radiatus]KAI8093824.1 mitochondrial carrier domain-containing protein [Halteromyces radiatus]